MCFLVFYSIIIQPLNGKIKLIIHMRIAIQHTDYHKQIADNEKSYSSVSLIIKIGLQCKYVNTKLEKRQIKTLALIKINSKLNKAR